MKCFNTTAVCIPEKHYMVDISERIAEIRKLVDAGKYFTINRARQYGKTTTLRALKKAVENDYLVLSLSFESISNAGFISEGEFVQAFSRLLQDLNEFNGVEFPEQVSSDLKRFCEQDPDRPKLDELYRTLRRWCAQSDRKIVMIIDEVDSSTNNQVFIDFLGLLRDGYIKRESEDVPALHSVILAGVTDVRHLKSKIRTDDEGRENSPWNISADFNIDMSLSEDGIRKMLDEYENDHHTGMDTTEMAKLIYDQTSGYPFLVSRISQLIDEQVGQKMNPSRAWTKEGFLEAIKLILSENNTLFQSIIKNLRLYPKLKESLRSVLMEGTKLTFNTQNDEIEQLQMYGLIRNDNNSVRVSNRILETMLYNMYMSEEEMNSNVFFNNGSLDRNQFIKDGKLDMTAVLNGFIRTFNLVIKDPDKRFKEENGREYFLLYLKPIINGTGNFYIEAQTRDQTRTDVIVDYHGEQFIVELKIWRGARYNEEGEQQICEYLERFDLQTGYMLSFCFNKNKVQGVKEIQINGKKLIEATV